MSEPSIVDEPVRQPRGSGPSTNDRRRVLMGHIDVKLAVTGNLEEGHVAVGCNSLVYCESFDGSLHRLNVCDP